MKPINEKNRLSQIFSFIFSPLLNRKSIKSKINILILFIEIASLAVFSLISIDIVSKDKLNSLRDRMQTANAKLATDTRNDFENFIIGKLTLIEDDSNFREYADNYDINLLVDTFRKFKETFYRISFLKSNGMEDVIVENGDNVIDKAYTDYSANKYFVSLRDDDQMRYVLTEEFLIAEVPYVQLFYKCLDKYHDVYAYLSVVFKIETIIERIIIQKYEKTGFAFLINSSGTILFHPDKKEIFKKISGNGDEFVKVSKSIMSSEENFVKTELNGLSGYYQYSPVKDFQWFIISVMPIEEFNKPILNIIISSLILVICTVIISLSLISVIMNIIIKPLFNYFHDERYFARQNSQE